MAIKVGMVSLGCPKNQVDAEMLLASLHAAGFEIVADAAEADAVIINTCGFINDAKRESIESILEYCALKESGVIRCVVVTGCLAQRYQQEVAKEIPEADVVLGIGANADIAGIIQRSLGGEKVALFPDKMLMPLEGERILSTQPHYAYLKIGEGCDNNCTYCAIPMIRGRYRSREKEHILEEARELAASGVKELIVVAQDTTRYGEDLYADYRLPELLEDLCKIDGFVWIRFLYSYPERITDRLLEVVAKEEKLVNYFDIPIQHISDRVLRRMNRHSTAELVRGVVNKIREKVPNVVLRTTLITGFPGETEEEYAELMDFVRQTGFDRLGCFAYSQEEGTPAAEFEDQLEEEVKQRRAEAIMQEQARIAEQKNKALVGREFLLLVDGHDAEEGCLLARTYMDAPEIDQQVILQTDQPFEQGDFVRAVITDVDGFDLVASPIENCP